MSSLKLIKRELQLLTLSSPGWLAAQCIWQLVGNEFHFLLVCVGYLVFIVQFLKSIRNVYFMYTRWCVKAWQAKQMQLRELTPHRYNPKSKRRSNCIYVLSVIEIVSEMGISPWEKQDLMLIWQPLESPFPGVIFQACGILTLFLCYALLYRLRGEL